jgi:hypothetical protein
MYPATIPGAMTKKIAEPVMASIRLIAEDSKPPLVHGRQSGLARLGTQMVHHRQLVN